MTKSSEPGDQRGSKNGTKRGRASNHQPEPDIKKEESNIDDANLERPTFTDLELLDCPICFLPLTPPVFQCKNGHISCSSCCTEVKNKCPSCRSSCRYRNRAIEKVLESVKVKCPNARYGCEETMIYNERHGHEKTCLHLPCSCPHPDCDFHGLSTQLYQHYNAQHKHSAVRFQYNSLFHITLNVDNKFLVLQEEKEGVLFILCNETRPPYELSVGNVLSISCISSGSNRFENDILVTGLSGFTVKSHSKGSTVRKRPEYPFPVGFLLVPRRFMVSNGQLELDICISEPLTF